MKGIPLMRTTLIILNIKTLQKPLDFVAVSPAEQKE